LSPAGRPPQAEVPTVSPHLLKLDAGTLLWRVHSTDRPAVCFKDLPTDEVFGGGRFDGTQRDPYPFLYAAPAPETAILETLTRDLPFHSRHFRTIRRNTVANMTLSPVLVNQQLLTGLGYRGLVLTDSLWMAPMRQAGTPGQVAVRAVQAGVDMLLMSPDLPGAYQAVLAKVRSDQAFRAQVRAAVRRILAAKAKVADQPAAPSC